jgi:hypothetical protein
VKPRRANDHPAWNWAFVAGIVVVPVAFTLKGYRLLDRDEFWGALVFAAFMMRPDRLVDLARARWAARSEEPAPADAPTKREGETL